MMRFDRLPKPAGFEDVEAKGKEWLEAPVEGRARRRPSLWRDYSAQLATGFRSLCGYSAIFVANGEVDHFVSEKEDPRRLYDWDNYRYADGWFNASKKDLRSDQILDPFEVEDGWFEILLPSMQLVRTTTCPPEFHDRADRMLGRLHLGHGEAVVRYRLEWYRMYKEGELTLAGLAKKAPLIARAIAKQQGGV